MFTNYKFQLSEEDYPNAKDLDKYLNKTGLRLEYNSTFKNSISFNKSVVHVPTDVYNGGKNTLDSFQYSLAHNTTLKLHVVNLYVSEACFQLELYSKMIFHDIYSQIS